MAGVYMVNLNQSNNNIANYNISHTSYSPDYKRQNNISTVPTACAQCNSDQNDNDNKCSVFLYFFGK